jgi:hypothetical protein
VGSQAKAVRVEAHKPCWREVYLQGHLVETEDAAPAPSSSEAPTPTLPDGPVSLQQLAEFERRVLEKLRLRATQQRSSTAGVLPVH